MEFMKNKFVINNYPLIMFHHEIGNSGYMYDDSVMKLMEDLSSPLTIYNGSNMNICGVVTEFYRKDDISK